MGRRNRSSSFQVGNNVHNNSNHHLLGIKIIKSSAASATNTANTTSMGSNHNTINNSSKAIIGTTKEDLSAATTLSRQFVHSMNKEGRTPFLCAVSAAASNTSASASSVVAAAAAAVGRNEVNRNENDTSSSRRIIIDGGEGQRNNHQDNNDKERERMDGLFIMDMLATRMKEMDALLSFTSSSSSSSSSVSSSLLSKKKKKKKNVGQANHKSSGNNSNSNNNSSSRHDEGDLWEELRTWQSTEYLLEWLFVMRKRERDNRIRRHLCYHYITLRIPSFQIEQIIDIFSCNSRMTSMSNDFESSRRAVLIGCSLISMANKNRSFALSIASTKSTPIVQSA